MNASTLCVFFADCDYPDHEDREQKAAELGFPVEGLDTETLEDVCSAALRLDPEASDSLLVRAFEYYFRFDALLPSLDAKAPPSRSEVIYRLDREFFDSLGDESSDIACRREGCDCGTVHLSAFCRKHHFENVRKRPCPF